MMGSAAGRQNKQKQGKGAAKQRLEAPSALTRYHNDRTRDQQEFAELRILPYRRLDVRNHRPFFESKMKIIANLYSNSVAREHDLNH
jgi:hypothetical protein